MKACFDHEKLNVYQEAIAFVAWADQLIQIVSMLMGLQKSLFDRLKEEGVQYDSGDEQE